MADRERHKKEANKRTRVKSMWLHSAIIILANENKCLLNLISIKIDQVSKAASYKFAGYKTTIPNQK